MFSAFLAEERRARLLQEAERTRLLRTVRQGHRTRTAVGLNWLRPAIHRAGDVLRSQARDAVAPAGCARHTCARAVTEASHGRRVRGDVLVSQSTTGLNLAYVAAVSLAVGTLALGIGLIRAA